MSGGVILHTTMGLMLPAVGGGGYTMVGIWLLPPRPLLPRPLLLPLLCPLSSLIWVDIHGVVIVVTMGVSATISGMGWGGGGPLGFHIDIATLHIWFTACVSAASCY